MSGRILIVDDNALNIKLLAAKLQREYYTVLTASDGNAALTSARSERPDLILLDIMMPGMDGFTVCETLKADPATAAIPVVMVTALSDTADRVRGLQAGADDFLSKPINDVALLARVRSLLRLKLLFDEWRLREGTAGSLGLVANTAAIARPAHVLLLEDDAAARAQLEAPLHAAGATVACHTTMGEIIAAAEHGQPDLVIASLDLQSGADTLQICGGLRAREASRHLPILLVGDESDIGRIARGLDLGANDYILRPVEGSELVARLRTQVQHKRLYDQLRDNYERSLSLALTDPLTGAFNRRYLDAHLPRLLQRCAQDGKPAAAMLFDLDHFKKVNDAHGHAAGDAVLQEVVARIQQSVRAIDLLARIGGEEFALVMPDTPLQIALLVAERLRERMAAQPIRLKNGDSLLVTISAGVAALRPDDTPPSLLERADQALYLSKREGRNRVSSENEIAA